jgi:Zn-dependent protease
MLYRFEVDQLAAKNGKLLVSRDGRHFLIGGLPEADIALLIAAFERDDPVSLDLLAMEVRRLLLDKQVLIPTDLASFENDKAKRQPRTKPLSYLLANPLRYIASAASLLILSCASLALYLYFKPDLKFMNLAGLVANSSPMDIGIALVTLFLTIAIHEIGHAAAACYYTGTVGKARFRFIWGVPAITVDVTSFCLTGRIGKVAISLAGAIFQIFVSLCILISTSAYGLQAGAELGIFLALFSLLPLPYYDGHWVLVDLLGRKFLPRLVHTRDWLELGYGASLLILFALSMPATITAIVAQFTFSTHLLSLAPARGTVMFCFSIFALVSLTIFGFSLLKSVFGRGIPSGQQS